MTFRDSNVVIIDTGRTSIKAGLGLHELLKTPTVEIEARVGLRRSASGALPEGTIDHATHSSASSSTFSSLAQYTIPSASVNDYLVGTQLDEALAAGQDILVSWPFASGNVVDWTQAEALWKHVLFTRLQRRRVQNESPVLLSIAAGLPRTSYERICQIFFERFNVAGFSLLERPMAQIYAANSLSGVVVDVDYDTTDVTPIYDGFIVRSAHTCSQIGLRDCQNYLAYLLRGNQSVVSAFSPTDAPLSSEALHAILVDFVQHVVQKGHIKVQSTGEAVVEDDTGVTDIAAILVAGKEKAILEGQKKKATAKANAAEQARAKEIEALDLLTVEFRGHSLTLGKERHRFYEPLFDPALLDKIPGNENRSKSDGCQPLQSTVAHAVRLLDLDQRPYVWSGLFVTGDITRHVRGLGITLQNRLGHYILSNSDIQSDVQTRSIRILNLPEYFPEYRDTGEQYAAFLGASITSKVSCNSNQNYVSKSEYSSTGPRSIIQNAPSLL
ncbi:actin-like ATPase domain-containing protein [Pterulicium gracile]|uniref:Actin-like ATPase domain-containing protein n=1 Tax=Pterulicium gracile TaxID=1884261 RepID=A0A5C3QVI5_9AGAR|nr:actin-like ATPase domain-containing protein [Pterula gracilis]